MSSQVIELFDQTLDLGSYLSVLCVVNCQRESDGSWSIWCVLSSSDPREEDEIFDYTKGITSAEEFVRAYCRCGVDFGFEPDLEHLEGHLPLITQEDGVLGDQLARWLSEDPDND